MHGEREFSGLSGKWEGGRVLSQSFFEILAAESDKDSYRLLFGQKQRNFSVYPQGLRFLVIVLEFINLPVTSPAPLGRDR